MDLADQMLAAAQRKVSDFGLSNVMFQTGNVTNLPFDVNPFGAVNSRFHLVFIPEILKAAAEISRVRKPL